MRSFVIIMMCCLLLSCSRNGGPGFSGMAYGRIDGHSDSVTLALEKAFYDVTPANSVSRLIAELSIAGNQKEDERERCARSLYWKGRLMRKMGHPDSAMVYIDRCLEIVDTAKHYYTYRRAKTLKTGMGTGEAREYMKRLMEDLDYYVSAGDKAMEASVAILIANALVASHQPDFALQYLNRADSLHALLGLDKYVVRNKINVASAYSALNRKDTAAEILLQVKDHPAIDEDVNARNTLYRNLYIYTGDIGYLKDVYRNSMQSDSSSAVNAVYEVLLSKHLRQDTTGGSGEADAYAMRALSRLPVVAKLSHRGAILQEVSNMYAARGRMDSAYHYLSLSVESKDKDEEFRQPEEIARIRNIQVLAEHQYQQKKTKDEYTVRLLVLSIFIIVVMACAAYIIIRIKERHRLESKQMQMDKISTELEMERRQRQYLALTLAMENTDRNLSQLKERVDTLCREGKISEKERKEVDSVIKTQVAHRDDWNRFNELFEKAHPQFESNLKKRYPDLSASQVKLAIYVYTGMDNKQIASFLNIRPESVKQARWRLRSKMDLAAEDSLEEKLRELTSKQE